MFGSRQTRNPEAATAQAAQLTDTASASSANARPVAQTPVTTTPAPAASSFAELLASYAPDDRQLLEAYYAHYDDGMMQFSTPAQRAWLARRGFPMPEDVLAAQHLSDAQLRRRAELGDATSASVLAERLYGRIGEDKRSYLKQVIPLGELSRTILASGSPFAGYFYQRSEAFKAQVAYGEEPRARRVLEADHRVTGWYLSNLLGDTRVPTNQMIDGERFSVYGMPLDSEFRLAGDPGEGYLDLATFVSLLKSALNFNPQLFANADDRWPKPPDH